MSKKKKKNLFFVFHKRIDGNASETLKSQSSIVSNQAAQAISNDSVEKLFDQIQNKLSGWSSVLFELDSEKEHQTCKYCANELEKADNIIVISDSKGNSFGVNGYYCTNCKQIHIDRRELIEIEKDLNGNNINTLKIVLLNNYLHNIELQSGGALPDSESLMRDLLDKMNSVNEDSYYKIVKNKELPQNCPVCDRSFDVSDNALKLRRGDNAEEYTLKGHYCQYCGLLYVKEESLLNCINDGMNADNLLEVIINNELDERRRLENELADGKILYIHKGNIICEREHHDIVSVTARVPVVNNSGIIEINVNYCRDCDKCFINNNLYEHYRTNSNLPAIRFARTSENGTFPDGFSTNWSDESPLHLLGYNVSQADGFSDAYRQNLLARIMDYGAMTKQEIGSYLTFFISRAENQANMKTAISKWERDLQFVENYKINRQPKVKVIGIEPLN